MDISRVITFFLLFILPLIVFPIGITPFEAVKVLLAEVLIVVFAVYALATKKLTHKQHQKPLRTILVVFGVLSLIDLFILRSSVSLFGNAFRLQGIFLYWCLWVWVWLSSAFQTKAPPFKLVVSAGIFLFLGAFYYSGHPTGRAIGSLGEPNALAATAVFFWPWLFWATRKRLVRILTIGGLFILLYLSGSRSGLLAFFLQSLFLLIHYRLRRSFKVAVVAVIILLVLSLGFPLADLSIYENRGDIWRLAGTAGAQKPILGWGIGNVEIALRETAQKSQSLLQYQYVDSAHNVLLDWWVMGGIVGLGSMLALLFLTLKNLLRQKSPLMFVLFIGLFTSLLFNPVSVVTLVAFWWVVGMSFNQIEYKQ